MAEPDVKSCKDCPSFMSATQAVGRFGRSPGVAVCGRYGTILDVPNNTERGRKKLQQHIASGCPGFGESLPPVSESKDMKVMLPDPTVLDPSAIDPVAKDACKTCLSCRNFIGEAEVSKELGYTGAMCAAKGKLLFSTNFAHEAKGCEYRQFGPVRGSLTGLHLLPEYSEAWLTDAPDPIKALHEMKKFSAIDPSEWPTDREVTEQDVDQGIKSWRKFVDPDGSGNEVYFPVYRSDYFTPDERALIPKAGSGDEHPELYVDHFGGMYGLGVAWLELDETPVMWGQAGVGKTELFRYAAWIMQVPFRRISFTRSTELDDIIGKMLYDPSEGTYFSYGRLPKAWQRPGVLCLDEPNTSQPEVWQRIRPLTDNSKQLVIEENEAEILDRNEDCYLGMAMNPAWDIKNIGALEIADADSNRLYHTYMEMPPEAVEKEIIRSYVRLDGWEIETPLLQQIMHCAKDIRGLTNEDALPITWAIRQQIKVARSLRWFTPLVAYRRAIGDSLDPESRRILLDQVKSHFEMED